jgi:membrane-associated phospholipid phosphatase
MRLGMITFIFTIVWIDSKYTNHIVRFIRYFYPLFFMTWLYGETDYMNNLIFPNLDPFFVNIDQQLFGYQPSLEFSKAFPQKWFNELMNFGYFSYYFFAVFVSSVIYFLNRPAFQESIFVVSFSFYIYYLIFILFPVAGPQFYFSGANAHIPDAYIFREGVKLVQSMGEAPTAAFPSSHVGVSIILLFLTFKYARKIFLYILPPNIILWFATVYIKAHYFIDVVGGFVSGFIILALSLAVHSFFEKRNIGNRRGQEIWVKFL